MNNLLETFSRCFNPSSNATTGSNENSGTSTPKDTVSASSVSDVPNRVKVELHDQEWEQLFSESGSSKKRSNKRDFEMSYGDVVQKAREAAQPARKSRQRKSDIFRTREEPSNMYRDNSSSSGVVSFFRENAQLLCFANPIGDAVCGGTDIYTPPNIHHGHPLAKNSDDQDDEDNEESVQTETSTQYFDRKHGVHKSKGQPMPLFSEFRIDCLEWSSNDEAVDTSTATTNLKDGQKIFTKFEEKIKSVPSRDSQIKKVFTSAASIPEDMNMPDAIRLSGSQSTLGSENLKLDKSRSRSSTSRDSHNMVSRPYTPTRMSLPRRPFSGKKYSPLR